MHTLLEDTPADLIDLVGFAIGLATKSGLFICISSDCDAVQAEHSGEPAVITTWKGASEESLSQMQTDEYVIGAGGYAFDAANLLCGGEIQGGCARCNGTNVTIRVREPLSVFMVSFLNS